MWALGDLPRRQHLLVRCLAHEMRVKG